jgi:hypothetical protein
MAGTPEQVYFFSSILAKALSEENLNEWFSAYTIDTTKSKKLL